jgi:hypothetical protein
MVIEQERKMDALQTSILHILSCDVVQFYDNLFIHQPASNYFEVYLMLQWASI